MSPDETDAAMNSVRRTLSGFDRRGDTMFAATVTMDGVRPMVISLRELPVPLSAESAAESQVAARLTIPDREILIKHLRKPPGPAESERDRLVFELAQTLLEPESDFLFDFVENDSSEDKNGRCLGFIFRRERLSEYLRHTGFNNVRLDSYSPGDSPRFVSRSLALSRGYLQFCELEESVVTAVVDLQSHSASIALLKGQEVVDLAHLVLPGSTLETDRQREQLAVDLKTVVNFRLAGTNARGASAGLCSVVVLGELADDSLLEILRRYFPAGVNRPRLHRGYFDRELAQLPDHAERYLPALGLTVN